MQDFLLSLVEMLAANPAAAGSLIALVVIGLLSWGVVSSSYRYR